MQVRKRSAEATSAVRDAGQARAATVEAGKAHEAETLSVGTAVAEQAALADPGLTESPLEAAVAPGSALVAKSWLEPDEATTGALQAAFAAYVERSEVVLKAEDFRGVECEAVEQYGDGAVVYKVSHGVGIGHVYFAAGAGEAVQLPHYRALKVESFVQVVKNAPQKYTLGVVYAHGESDFHNDTMTEVELEKAAWAFMAKDGVQGRVGLMHEPGTDGAGKVVESYIYRGPEWTMKAANDASQTQVIKSGDWLMGVVWGDAAWDAIQKGKVNGYSLQGAALKEEVM